MKGLVRKIKDNEWIAEFGAGYTYPIVSPLDIEWLEKNCWDGKEVDGSMRHSESGIEAVGEHGFYLNTPPIHSDPAGEEIFSKADMLLAAKEGFYETQHNGLATIKEYKIKKTKNGWEVDNLLFDDWLKTIKPPTPQTGRIYTASEMEDAFFAGERSFRLRNNPDAKFVKFLDWLKEHNKNHKP